ncbi:phosphatidylserine/phosphatidylglycerophosphate/cardiolipin synthase-like enzyme [Breoghania corrubedonensis]|uniref:Phospholipase D n=1 Tax=Breoghania corrubedonensis TaxID=665038 RepID=A0A2T5V6K1_9HYPH|nr:VTT domain-containing protein [Breoghania corrubedonensis]PTW59388.1 phosphatidylserine/phosphatidylglycerophosphate/cardiolipin synthase-like enzyme [Breoghania corrubedonensis]
MLMETGPDGSHDDRSPNATRNGASSHDAPTAGADESVFEPGRNVWRVEHAPRVAPLIDAGAYFGALRKAMLMARKSIVIVGWDIESRMRLVGPDGTVDDDLPETFAAFLTELVRRNDNLHVRLLLWDYSMLFSLERELAPRLRLFWSTPPQIELCLDDEIPLGASQHQKIVVIDDTIAFSGGLDLTRRRWDNPTHKAEDERRIDPTGSSYGPFHDVQMAVDGDAATALGDLVRERWRIATDERLERPATDDDVLSPETDPWPEDLTPLFRDARIGISRTCPAHEGAPAVTEVEDLWYDMIGRAERAIYIENQFLTALTLARKLADRLKQRPKLEAVVVVPDTYPEWLAKASMLDGRQRFMQVLRDAGVADRVRLVYPQASDDGVNVAIMVHAKVMVIDDRWLRIGSANLCNRSIGFDSECDLTLEARDEAQRFAVREVRNRLLGEHVGAEPTKLQAAIDTAQGSLFDAIDALPKTRRTLVPVADEEINVPVSLRQIGDPPEPLYGLNPAADVAPDPRWWPTIVRAAIAIGVIGLAILAWRYSPVADPERLGQLFQGISRHPWAPGIVIASFIAGGLVAFPVTVLILATVAVFGGWLGMLLAASGATLSAIVTYLIGRKLGQRALRRMVGPRISRIRHGMSDNGVVTIASIRLVPIAPFTLINLVAGAMRVRFVDYCIGTILGLAPGLLTMTLLAQQITRLVNEPTLGRVAVFAGLIVFWSGIIFALQFLVRRYRRARS